MQISMKKYLYLTICVTYGIAVGLEMASGGPSEASSNGTPSWFTSNVYPIIEGPLVQCQEYSRATVLESIQWLRWWCHCPSKAPKLKPGGYMKVVADEAAKMTNHVMPTKGAVKNLTDKLLGPDLSDGDAIGRNLTLAALKIIVVTLVVVCISYFVFGVRRMISRYRHAVQLENYVTADQALDPMDLPIYEPRKENDHIHERRAPKRIAGPAKTSFVQPPPESKSRAGCLVPHPIPLNINQPASEGNQTLSCEEMSPPPIEKLRPVQPPQPATSSNSFSLSAVTNFFSAKSKPNVTATENSEALSSLAESNSQSYKSVVSGSEASFTSSKDTISSTQMSVSTVTPSTSMASTTATPIANNNDVTVSSVSKREKKKTKKKKRKESKGSEALVPLKTSPKSRSTSVKSISPVTSLVVPPKRVQSPCRTPMATPTKPPSIIADPKKMVMSPVAGDNKLVAVDPKTVPTVKVTKSITIPASDSDSTNESICVTKDTKKDAPLNPPKTSIDPPKKKSNEIKHDAKPESLPKKISELPECPTQPATDPTQSPHSSNREVPPTPVSSSENFKKASNTLPMQSLNETEPPSDRPLIPAAPHTSFTNRKDAAKEAANNNGAEILSRAAEVLSKEAKTTKPAMGSDERTELKWKGELRSNEQFNDSKPGTPPKTPQEIDDKTAERRGAGLDATASSYQSCDSVSSTTICNCEDCNRVICYDSDDESDHGRVAAGRSASETEDFLSAQQERFIQMQERIRQNTTALGILQMYPRGSTSAGCPECQTRRLHPITFRWYDDEPQSVFLTGSFVGWQSKIPMHRLIERREGNVRSRGFCLELRLPRGHHEYKFIVDKRWAVDEKRQPTIKTREGHMHHVIHV